MDVDGCWWMLMDVDGCWWMLMDVDGCWWMLMDVDGCWWLPIKSPWNHHCYWSSPASHGSHGQRRCCVDRPRSGTALPSRCGRPRPPGRPWSTRCRFRWPFRRGRSGEGTDVTRAVFSETNFDSSLIHLWFILILTLGKKHPSHKHIYQHLTTWWGMRVSRR